MPTDQPDHHARVVNVMDSLDLDAVVLQDPANLAWFTGGGRPMIVEGIPVLDVVVRRDGIEVVTDRIEADRLRSEELGGLEGPAITWKVREWDQGRDAALPTGPRIGSDSRHPDCRFIGPELVAARRRLTPLEIDRYRQLGRETAVIATSAAQAVEPSMTEHELAGLVGGRLLAAGIAPTVLLTAGTDRLERLRHPLPTTATIGDRAMIVICGRRHGLVVALTRIVSFGPLPSEIRERYGRLLRVERAFLDATRPSAVLGDVFRAGSAAYAANGFDPDEWRRHHQGGSIGYQARDEVATLASTSIVDVPSAWAWNPSAASMKVEDTILVTEHRHEVLTVDPAWPVSEEGALERPLILELD